MRRSQEQFHKEVVKVELVPIKIDDPRVELMSAVEAAEMLGVSKPVISVAMDKGEFSIIRRSGSSRRWLLRSEVVARLDSRRVGGQ